MASQPANAAISVHRRIRTQRADRRHDAIRSILSPGLRPLIAVPPGEEVRVIRTRDASDTSDRYRFGHFVTVFNRDEITLETALESVANLENPFLIGRDKFFNKDSDNVRDDIHQEVRDLN